MNKSILSIALVLISVALSASVLAVDLTIPDVNGNTIQGEDYTTTITITNNDVDTVNLSYSANDLNGPASIAASNVTFTPSSTTALGPGESVDIDLTITIANDQAIGDYTGSILVDYDNSTHTGQLTSSITVNVATSNHAPTITSNPIESATVNQQYSYQATANDDDSDPLTFALVTGPSGMVVSTDGLVTWTPNSAGTEDVNISVTDNEATEYQDWTITTSIPGSTLTFSDVRIGDEDQERDETVTSSFVITNQGTQAATGLQVTSSAASEYEVVLTPQSTTVPAGGSVTVNIEAYLPDDLDSGVTDIGDITATASSIITVKNLEVEVANHLSIDRVKLIIDGKSNTMDDGDSEDIQPGDDIEIEVRVENTFDDNINIEDIDIDISSDSDLDWDDSDNINRLRDGKDDTLTFTFDVPIDLSDDDSPFEVTIEVNGQDENGADHSDTLSFEVDLDKERDDLRFDDYTFRPSSVTCDDTSVRLSITVLNVGSDDQDQAVLQITSDDLDYEQIIKNIEIYEGDEETEEVTIPLPSNLKEGEYFVDLEIYTSTRDDDLTDIASVILPVRNCGTTNNNDDDNSDTSNSDDNSNNNDNSIDVITPPPTSNGQIIQTVAGTPTKSNDFLDSTTYLALLIILVVLLLIIIVMLGAKSFK